MNHTASAKAKQPTFFHELELTHRQFLKALVWLSLWHIAIIAASNYLVQFPFEIGPVANTWSAFTFPFIFLATDLTVRIFGPKLARVIIFCAMIPALALSYAIGAVFADGGFVGWQALKTFDLFVFRIALASFSAYAIGQLLDVIAFNRLRQKSQWWAAPAMSTILGSAADSVVFWTIAFWRASDPCMAQHWISIGLADYACKITISILFFLPAYGVLLKVLSKKLTTVRENVNPAPGASPAPTRAR